MNKAQQRILIVGLNYAPEPVGIGPYTQGLAEALVHDGRAADVICGQPYYPQWRRYPGFGWGYRTSREAGVSVTRCPHYIPLQPGGLKRIVHLASFAATALPAALVTAWRPRKRPDVVVVVAPAMLSAVSAWAVARLCRAKLWIHIQDFEAEAAVATGLLHAQGWPARLALAAERAILRLADRVSTISPQMATRLATKGVDPARIIELRNWADSRFAADYAGGAELRRAWGLGERTVALYSGNVGRKQGIEVLVEAAHLLQHRTDIAIVICGEGPNRAALDERAKGLNNVQLHDLQPAENMGALLAMADLHLLPQIAGAADLVLPSKLTNMLASARPVVATTDPGTGLYVEVDGCGAITPPEDAAALAQAITALADDPERRAKLGAAAQKRAAQRWSKPAIIARWLAALDDLT
ncbi:WcaI family glycosyltransferase [Novosphingobium sp.]|uniref:WcaI family glycosyltransferase n=1 Tax=Novosphingobium sp. TaxID=1874826 RepID=UPI0025CF1116|nr:WcaI family glycosyltransferase [Novosphingobium sp.]